MRTTVRPEALPFDEAIAFLRDKIDLPTGRWTDLMGGMHSRAFVVAGAMRDELLTDLHASVLKALEEGTTIEEFRRDFGKIVQRHGWNYRGEFGWRTATIFNTNIRTAHAAGHYKQMTSAPVLAARPFWQYLAGFSENPRQEHLAWAARPTVLPADDPWWSTHYPPNGWGCKCQVTSLSREEMESRGLAVTGAPDDGTYEWTNPATGEVVDVPRGIDPGWDYNPGETAWGRTEALRLMDDQGPWVDIDPWLPSAFRRPEVVKLDEPAAVLGKKVRRGNVDGLRAEFRKAVGGDEAAFVDPTGETVMVSQAIVDHILEKPKTRWDGREAFFPFIRELIEDPFEIWVSFARSEISGRVSIRRKYVKTIRLDRNRVLGLFAEFMNGHWVSKDFFRGKLTGAGRLRKGRLLYGR